MLKLLLKSACTDKPAFEFAKQLNRYPRFARYFDVECRLVPTSVESKYRLDPKRAMEYVDENTIGVFVILGSTYV